MHNLFCSTLFHFFTVLMAILSLLIFFYSFLKAKIFKIAPMIALKTRLIQHYPFSQVVGAIELSSVAIVHVVFCILLSLLFNINIASGFFNVSIMDCFYGALIGIGCVGLSILLCTVGIKIIEKIALDSAPTSLNEWLAVSNAGWIRHHKHTLKIFPFALALLIITLQIGSEETIFRSILIQIFAPYGIKTAFCVSTLLFIHMQIFHMPNMMSAMFPMIGATVLGITHGLLFLYHPSMTPLIISHLTFFIFTVI